MMAGSVMASVPVVLSMLASESVVQGLAAGAVKG
jgi:ABC-type glycerol-3-phosphate transport system permease component